MTSREFIDLLNIKSGRDGDPLLEVTYGDLRNVMKDLGIVFQSRMYRGMAHRCYLTKQAMHKIADHMGIDLYPIRPR